MIRWGLTVLVLACGPAGLAAQAGRSAANEGNRLYGEGRFAEAHERYLEALREAPDSPIIRFNNGNALYQGSDYERAMAAYQNAVRSGDPELISDAWYNIGNVLYRQQQLPQSLEAFKQALRLDPRDPNAKHNLERVLEQMQNPQQDQNEQNQDENQPDENQNENQPDENQNQQDQENEEGQEDQEEQEQDQDQAGNPDQPQDEDEDPDESDQDQPRDPDDPNQNEQEGEPPPGQQGRPPEMSREQAERLLEAIQEDQDEVDRQPRTAARGRRPRKDW